MYPSSRMKIGCKSKPGIISYIFVIAVFCLIFTFTFYRYGEKARQYYSEGKKIMKTSFVDYITDLGSKEGTLSSTVKEESASSLEVPRARSHILEQLRALMKDFDHVPEYLDAYIVLSQDAHQNQEFVSDRDRRLQYLSGFTGEQGVIVITEQKAYLLTYYNDESEISGVDENWTLVAEGGHYHISKMGQWFGNTLPEGAKIGFHSFTMQYEDWKKLQDSLQLYKQTLVPVNENLVDTIWTNQTSVSNIPVIPLELHYSGETAEFKIREVREKMTWHSVTVFFLQALDEIAWLLNLRGADIPYVPVFFAYLVITSDQVLLFLDEGKVTPAVKQHLQDENSDVVIHPYADTLQRFTDILNADTSPQNKVWLAKDTSYAFVNVVPPEKLVLVDSPVALMKAVKNHAEIEGFMNAHIKDAVALCCFFAWLEKEVVDVKSNVTELSAASKLEEYRKRQPNYMGESFPTISASGPNAAIIHYRVSAETNRSVNANEIYLCDSGAHYTDGTTDVTRTVHFGTPSDYEKECFTRVLKGHIQLRTMKFPENTKGNILDAFARKSLWDAGLEYFHSTGHGVGAVLNVHERPIDISPTGDPTDPGFGENMLLSNEPGYYEEGKFGIRIENIVRTVPTVTKYARPYRKFLTFEDITLVPIQTSTLLDRSMLTEEEILYINEYHAKCREKVAPLLEAEGETDGLAWLMKETEPI